MHTRNFGAISVQEQKKMSKKSAENKFAVMRWLTDNNRLSVHDLNYVSSPKMPLDDYKPGMCGLAVFVGFSGLWEFRILNVGGKIVLMTWMSILLYMHFTTRALITASIYKKNKNDVFYPVYTLNSFWGVGAAGLSWRNFGENWFCFRNPCALIFTCMLHSLAFQPFLGPMLKIDFD